MATKKDLEKIALMREFKQDFDSRFGPFGEERLSENFSSYKSNKIYSPEISEESFESDNI